MVRKVPLVGMILLVAGSLALLGCPKQPQIGGPGESQGVASSSTVARPAEGSAAAPAGGGQGVSRSALPTETPTGAASGPGAAGPRPLPAGTGGAAGAKPASPGASGPAAAPAAVSPLKDVYFEYDRSSILEDQKPALNQNIAWLKANPGVKVTIEGHCDERGTAEYNLGLGERRALTIREYLVGEGIPADRLATISYGKERPQVLGHDESAWKWNRRAHFAPTTR